MYNANAVKKFDDNLFRQFLIARNAQLGPEDSNTWLFHALCRTAKFLERCITQNLGVQETSGLKLKEFYE